MKSTLHAKIGSLQSQIHTQLSSLTTKISNLGSLHGTDGSSSSQANTRICAALDAAYAKLVSIALQDKFGCNNVA